MAKVWSYRVASLVEWKWVWSVCVAHLGHRGAKVRYGRKAKPENASKSRFVWERCRMLHLPYLFLRWVDLYLVSLWVRAWPILRAKGPIEEHNVTAYSLRSMWQAGGGPHAERLPTPAGPIVCREHTATLHSLHHLIGPSVRDIGRTRIQDETKWSGFWWCSAGL